MLCREGTISRPGCARPSLGGCILHFNGRKRPVELEWLRTRPPVGLRFGLWVGLGLGLRFVLWSGCGLG
eukprot:2428836-Rhodomonas_salina.1